MTRFSTSFCILALSLAVRASTIGQSVMGGDDDAKSWSWKDCGDATNAVQVGSIAISPDPPVPGKDLTVTMTGTARNDIAEGAYADVTLKVGLVKVLQKEFNLCQEAREANLTMQCPVATGDFKVAHTVTLPKEIPPAPFTATVRGYNVDDDDMLCLDIKVDFRPRRESF